MSQSVTTACYQWMCFMCVYIYIYIYIFAGMGTIQQNGAGRGLRGTFAHGSLLDVWLIACSREKLTIGVILFAPFGWIRLGWYLQTITVFEDHWKIKPVQELEQDLSIFSDGGQVSSSVWLRTTYTYNTAAWLVQWHGLRLSAASNAFAWVLLSPQKRVPHVAFWLFWFCVCGHWLLSIVLRPPRVCLTWP